MTLSSVPASGTSTPTTNALGAIGAHDSEAEAAPSDFEILLANSHAANESEPSRCDRNSNDPSGDDAAATDESQAGEAADANGTDGAPPTDPPAKPADPTDPSGLLAALAGAPVVTVPTADIPVASSTEADTTVPITTDTPPADAVPVDAAPVVPNEGDDLLDLSALPPVTEDVEIAVAPTPPSSAEAAMEAFAELSTTPTTASPPAAAESASSWYTAPEPAPHAASPQTAAAHERMHAAPPPPIPTGTEMIAPTAPQQSSAMSVNATVEEGTFTPAAATPAPPAEQLVSILAPLRTTPNGTYTLRLELKPPELGRVEMRVEMRDGVLHASIHAEHQTSAQLVRDALGELREHLNAEGVHTGELTVSDGGVGAHGRDGSDARSRAAGSSRSDGNTNNDDDQAPTPPPPPPLDSEATSLLDVRV